MRVHRIALTDVRGFTGRIEVAFATDGVTIVEAPNEAGKSTLFDAVDVALAYKDSSKHRDVKSLWPADRDVPPIVEVEFSCGEHRLLVTKQFRKQSATTLQILAPTPRTLHGDDAHDHLRALLEAEVDLALFEALRFTQGRDLDAVALHRSDVLADRLDTAAGGTTGSEDGALFDRVREEYLRWYTPTGQPGAALRQVGDARQQALDRHRELHERLTALQDDADELARIESELPALHAERRDELDPALEAARAAAQQVATVAAGAARCRAERDRAVGEVQAARARLEARSQLVADHAERAAELVELEDHSEPAAARLAQLEAELARHEARLADVNADLHARRTDRERAQLVVDLQTAISRADQLRARLERADELLATGEQAEQIRREVRVDADAVRAIATADEQLRLAEARLRVGAPQVRMQAQQALTVTVDGHEHEPGVGDEVSYGVGTAFELVIPDVVRLEVAPGGSSEQLHRAVEAAREQRDQTCRELGVADLAEAETALERRRGAESVLERRDEDLRRTLDGLTHDELRRRCGLAGEQVEDLRAQLLADTHTDTGGTGQVQELDPGVAERARTAAAAAEQQAHDELERVRAARDVLDREVTEQRMAVEVARGTVTERRAGLDRLADRLAAERAAVGDDELGTQLEAAEATEVTATEALEAADAQLAALDPELVELQRDNLRRTVESLVERIGARERRAAALQETLKLRGEDGLGERVQEAADQLERASADERRSTARAAAVRLLHDELREARDEAYQAYRAPLRARIGGLARLLYGRDVELELDEELAIVRRTLDDVTLDWEQLSAGAREQLAILAALAAAQLAGADGVPFVLDDALGYTDQQRLERLGALLGRTDDAQVIVLTCVADRFRHVGGATTVVLEDLGRA
jgi:hypothetical protein